MIPVDSILRNLALAKANLYGGNQRACAWMGGPVVLIKCSTPCLVCRVEKVGLVISRKLVRRLSYSFPGYEMVPRWSTGAPASQSGEEKYVFPSMSCLSPRSTRSKLVHRKSAPIGAMTKLHMYCFITKHSVMVRFLSVRIVYHWQQLTKHQAVWFACPLL